MDDQKEPIELSDDAIEISDDAIDISDDAIELAEGDESGEGPSKIRVFGEMKKHEDEWSRKPNADGSGAIHLKTFHAKITPDSLEYMDRQVNEWLDAHEQYEVKFVTATIGPFTTKTTKEPALLLNVWV